MPQPELVHIIGNTFYIPGGTNIGVYKLDDESCIVVDTGLKDDVGKKIVRLLEKNSLKVTGIINTHGHTDHFGGNWMVQKMTGCRLYATKTAKSFIEDPLFHLEYIYGAHPPKGFGSIFGQGKASNVTDILEPGELIGSTPLRAINLPGHTRDHIGIETPDKVMFVGDCVVSDRILSKYGIPFIHDVGAQLKSLEFLKTSSCDWYLPCHGPLTPSDKICELVELNKNNVDGIVEDALAFCSDGRKTQEEIKVYLCTKYKVELDLTEDRFMVCTTSAVLSYLCDNENLDVEFESGAMFYKQRK